MIPLRSEIKRHSFPLINILLILANIAVFIYQLSLPPRAGELLVQQFGLVPLRAERALAHPGPQLGPAFLPLVTSMFLHGGFLHILGNMLFLWVFGGNVEDRLGHLKYLGFYFICGIGAGMAQLLVSWGSRLPSIGASGAISGVMGAYIVLYPGGRILMLIPLLFFFFTVRIPALIVLGYWFVIQFLSGLSTIGQINQGGVAWWAHIGGFILGMFLVWGLRQQKRQYGFWSPTG
ncbi:MAG TPA: rhomboid family intramembrane serine protease [Candidatus Acidoferrales bacterium]|jgi:membrane associated rhomboid family serine protease|nr:rhomboid family intramembrane serine protease [Candidatus Acidoferrales bacterium]